MDRLLVLVRHGQSEWNLKNLFTGWKDPDLTPKGIEAHFGITGGHIHHLDNTISFTDRMPYATGVPGLYAGSAGCHPAGSVIGAAGHNAAERVLRDLGS